ncbi:MAG TPA: glycosyltransferase family 4 protein, partial [Ignavibacteria bacterium]|nr:glycosyltransferase family 4 protein [Ignavibacteria bacterium]
KDKIKLVHIISNLSLGGAQVLLFDILHYLSKKNDLEIYVITIDSGEYIEKFKKAGIKVFDLMEKGLVNPKIYFKMKKLLKYLNPDIVHTHLNKADFYGRIAAKKTGVKLIYSTCHNYSTHHKGADVNKISIFDYIDNFVVKYSGSYLIAISEIVKKYLINRDKRFDSITDVIYNGVNISKKNYQLEENEIDLLRIKYNVSKDDFLICLSGRFDKQKGHLFLLDALSEKIKERKNIKIIMPGDGILKKEVENYISKNDLNEFVILPGFHKDIEKIIEISDLTIVPSLWEGFGLVVIESMVKKKVVLASDTGGIPEIIEHGENGYLFKTLNKSDFLEKFNFIYSVNSNLPEIQTKALNTVEMRFDINKNSEFYYLSYLSKFQSISK